MAAVEAATAAAAAGSPTRQDRIDEEAPAAGTDKELTTSDSSKSYRLQGRAAMHAAPSGEQLCPHGYRLRHRASSERLAQPLQAAGLPTFELDMRLRSPFTESAIYTAIKAGSCELLRQSLTAIVIGAGAATPPGGSSGNAQLPLDTEFGCSYMHVVADAATKSDELHFVPMVHELALAGVDPQLTDISGRTALDVASTKNLGRVAVALLQVGASIGHLRAHAAAANQTGLEVLLQAKLAEHSPSLGHAICEGDCRRVFDLLGRWHRVVDVRHGGEQLLDLADRLAAAAVAASKADAAARVGMAQVLSLHARPAELVQAALAGNVVRMREWLTRSATAAECKAALALARSWSPQHQPAVGRVQQQQQQQQLLRGHQRTLREAAAHLGHGTAVLAAIDECLTAAAAGAAQEFTESPAAPGASLTYCATVDGQKQSMPVQSSSCTII